MVRGQPRPAASTVRPNLPLPLARGVAPAPWTRHPRRRLGRGRLLCSGRDRSWGLCDRAGARSHRLLRYRYAGDPDATCPGKVRLSLARADLALPHLPFVHRRPDPGEITGAIRLAASTATLLLGRSDDLFPGEEAEEMDPWLSGYLQ